MVTLSPNDSPRSLDMLVAFNDLARFARVMQRLSEIETFRLLDQFAELTGDIIEAAGGQVLKFTGDASLVVFPEALLDGGVRALLRYKDETDAWLRSAEHDSELNVMAHFGPVVYGELGTRSNKRADVIGATVFVAARLPSRGITLTPQVFRRLVPATRKHFKKHTPPVTYVGVGERHLG